MRSKIPHRFATELTLALHCCVWPSRASVDGRIRELAASVRWPDFYKILRRHHVDGLAWNALRSSGAVLPDNVAAELQARAQSVAIASMVQAVEAAKLKQLFESRGLPILFLKGSALAIQAFGTVALKRSKDIDILVPQKALPDAARILDEAGYALVFPAKGECLLHWHRHWKESGWRNQNCGTIVELHTSLADSQRLLASLKPFNRCQSIEVPSVGSLPTLAQDELFAYLSVHGASSAWFRLKWIADFSALFGGLGPSELERLYHRSQELGAGRSAAQALLLAHGILGLQLAPAFKRMLEVDRLSRILSGVAMRMIREVHEPTERILGTLPIHLSQLWLLPGGRFMLGELARQLASLRPPLLKFLSAIVQGLHSGISIRRRSWRPPS